ncbi:MAG: RnfABCDGE type electron transport complex subunit D [Reyranella sp.]|uniref:RnfABCDGE type electron transport complex subunit D n=1 Tax=Reyranella sp. TaxID=1929291 RepID=UPI003D0FEC7A
MAAVLRGLDARWLQIGAVGGLLMFGVLLRDFALRWEQSALCFASALAAQWAWMRILGLRNTGYLSAIVTGIGLSVLVRADSLWVHPLVAVLAISAKFTVRIGNKHVFNPANLGVMIAILFLPGAWLSPGQWGSDVIAALWFVALGVTVTVSAKRFDIAWAFLACYGLLLVGRLLWLDQRWAVLLNQLSSGGLLLFTFFMITDPMTTPNDRRMRWLYAALVAVLAFIWQFVWYRNGGPVWALFLLSPLVPLLDWLRPGARHQWRSPMEPATARPASVLTEVPCAPSSVTPTVASTP